MAIWATRVRRAAGRKRRTAAGSAGGGSRSVSLRLDGVTDGAEDLAGQAAQEDQRDDRDDRDKGGGQRGVGETLAVPVPTKRGDELVSARHAAASWMSPHPRSRAAP